MRVDGRCLTPVIIASTLVGIFGLTLVALGQAPQDAATVTETQNVVLHHPQTGEERPAKVSDEIKGADVLRTGERSRAEIEFQDKTVTRLGSQSLFSFDGKPRQYKVRKGIALICVPKEKETGKARQPAEISTSAVTAAIEGTTVLVQEIEVPPTAPGQPPRYASRMIFLDGHGNLSTPDGKKKKKIRAGQMILKFEDDPDLPNPVDVDVSALVRGSGLVNGFTRSMPTMDAIANVIQQQQVELAQGLLQTPTPQTGPTGGPGLADPPFLNQNPVSGIGASGTCEDVGNGFLICDRPIRGMISEPLGDGNYVCRLP